MLFVRTMAGVGLVEEEAEEVEVVVAVAVESLEMSMGAGPLVELTDVADMMMVGGGGSGFKKNAQSFLGEK